MEYTEFSRNVLANVIHEDEFMKKNLSYADRERMIDVGERLWGNKTEDDFKNFPVDRERYAAALLKMYVVTDGNSIYDLEGVKTADVLEKNMENVYNGDFDFSNKFSVQRVLTEPTSAHIPDPTPTPLPNKGER